MENDVYITVDSSGSCARNRHRYRHKRPFQLFHTSGPLDFVARAILGLLPKTTSGDQYVVVVTDRYSNITRAIFSSETTSVHIANIILDHWIIPSGISSFLLTDNGSQFASKLFATLCGIPGVRCLTTTAYHPLTNSQAKQISKTRVAELEKMSLETNPIETDLHSRSPKHTKCLYIGTLAPCRTGTCYASLPQDCQHTTPLASYRPTHMAKNQPKPCGNRLMNESEPCVPERTSIYVKGNSSINRITFVAFAKHRPPAHASLSLSTDPFYQERNLASPTISQWRCIIS